MISEKNRKLTAYHEGGHALVALYTDGAHPVHKATVVPRGMALGMVTQLPETDDETSVSRRQLLAKLDVCMGGRVAEELIFGAGLGTWVGWARRGWSAMPPADVPRCGGRAASRCSPSCRLPRLHRSLCLSLPPVRLQARRM